MQYFGNCQNLEEAKVLYRKLAKALHPDAGGNAQDFAAMKNEFDRIIVSGFMHTIEEEDEILEDVVETVSDLDFNDINNTRAYAYFAQARIVDNTYDIIDDIINQAKGNNKKLWVFQEVQKLYSLNLDHFKYTTFKLGSHVSVAHQLYRNYLQIKA